MKTRIVDLSWLSLTVVFGILAFNGVAFGDHAGIIATCEACHGKDGVSSSGEIPTIAGISAFLLADYLYAFHDGARTCDDAVYQGMCTTISDLSDDKIEELGEYFGGLSFKAADQVFDADKAAAGAEIHEAKCAKCHTEGGSNPDDDASILAGQWLPYLKASLSKFVAGTREQPGPMQRKTADLSDADVEALAHYYASQK